MHTQNNELVLEQLPSGDFAWLRLDPHHVRIVETASAPQLDPDERFTITDAGRRALRMADLFG